jgi:glycosyltransferase involved in cell wall biosynthesis
MRILAISNLYPPDVLGGYEILCGQVCDLLHARGHQVEVLTTRSSTLDAHPYPVNRSLDLYLPFSQPARFARARRFVTSRRNHRATRAAIREYKPDVVFIWSQLRLTTGSAKAAEASGIPVAYTMNDEHLAGYLSRQTGWTASFKQFMDEHILSIGAESLQLRHTTCISQTVKRRLCEQGLPIPSSRVIFQGIPVEKFLSKPNPGRISSFPKVLYVGQLHSYKGVHTAIQAVGRLHREGHKIELTICGKGTDDYERHLRQLAEATGASITFMGLVPHDLLPEIYRNHDLFVFPSTWAEPFGLTHLEAMASGTPVVSTAEGGHGEFLRHDVNACIFKPNSEYELADRLQSLIRCPEKAVRIAIAARAQVERDFSLQAYAQRLEAWLTSII